MKAIDIALKDMKRSFRSAFALMFMFVIPLLVTGMFYLMFGNTATAAAESEAAAPRGAAHDPDHCWSTWTRAARR